MSNKLDNSFDLIYAINKNISLLKNSKKSGGALKNLKKYKQEKYSFLTKTELNKLNKRLSKIIQAGGGKKLQYDYLGDLYADVNNEGVLSPDLEDIVSRNGHYKINPDIDSLLKSGGNSNPINTAYIEEMVGGQVKSHPVLNNKWNNLPQDVKNTFQKRWDHLPSPGEEGAKKNKIASLGI